MTSNVAERRARMGWDRQARKGETKHDEARTGLAGNFSNNKPKEMRWTKQQKTRSRGDWSA